MDDVEAAEDLGFDDAPDRDGGPYDIDDIGEDAVGSRLDLGSVLLPVPQGGQIQVEMAPNGSPQAVHLVTRHGRITVSAYAAPKSAGQWREVAGDLSESLRKDEATVSMETGPWGRELHASTANADLRFIGVDGYRWMVRCVVAGPAGSTAAGSPLVEIARAVVADTVVRRGREPHPVRTPLPVVLPKTLADQLVAAQQQQMAARQQATQGAPGQGPATGTQPRVVPQGPPSPRPVTPPQQPRRGGSGSAMQQLGF